MNFFGLTKDFLTNGTYDLNRATLIVSERLNNDFLQKIPINSRR